MDGSIKTKQIKFFVIMWQIVMIKNGRVVPVNNWNNGANVMEKIRNNIGCLINWFFVEPSITCNSQPPKAMCQWIIWLELFFSLFLNYPLCPLWQYGVLRFQAGGSKLKRFLPENQHTQRKLLNYENWCNGEVSKSAKIWLPKSIFYVKNHRTIFWIGPLFRS